MVSRRCSREALTLAISALAVAACGCQPLSPDANFFRPLEGTWSTVKDGLSLTVVISELDTGGYEETQFVDDGNTLTTVATFTYDRRGGVWRRLLTLPDGATSEFVGGLADDGTMVLEQVSYNDREFTPPQSRLVYSPVSEGMFTLDWQSRAADDSWTPRSVPFVHERVNRPEPPANEGRIAFISNREGNWEVYTMAPDGTDIQNVSNHPSGDHRPAWIAAGSRLAFRSQRARDDDGWDRWEVDIDGTDANPVDLPNRLNNPDLGMFPEVHPSGSYVVNAAERDGQQDIYVWRFDGGGERVVAPSPGLDYRPIFSPDGDDILFISERDGNADIYVVAFDGSNLRQLTTTPGIDRYARWSPDGSRIGFVSDRDGDLEVYVMNADGSDLVQLTDNDAEDGEISWSPDGRYIAFRSDASGNGEINVVSVESGEITNLTLNPAYDGEPVWSPATR